MKKSVAAVTVSLFACLMLFQNCGGGLKAASVAGDASGASGTPDPTGPDPVLPGTTSFAKGDAFNYNSVGNKSQMVQAQLDALGYATYTAGSKAIAINAQGLGYVSRKTGGTQADANTTALEGCFALGGSPCALLAVGDVFEVSSTSLPTAYTYSLSAPTAINAASIPFVMPNLRASIANQYNAATGPKALAISVDGAYVWITASDTTPVTSLAEARRVALERCELNAAITPCTLFAENSTVVMNPAAINRTPIIEYGRTTIGASLPGMKDAHYNQFVSTYLASVNGSTVFGAIYIGSDGSGGMAYNTNANTANTTALDFCNANVNSGYVCYKYATSLTVQSPAPNLIGLKNFPVPHCKSVPRATCAAHKAMGCASGLMYTMNGATPALENCL